MKLNPSANIRVHPASSNPCANCALHAGRSSRQKLCAASLLLFSIALGSGCATQSLWSETSFIPALPPNLALFEWEPTQDVLAVYDEWEVRSERYRRRAFLLNANRAAVAAHQPPVFLEHTSTDDLTPIRVLASRTPSPVEFTSIAYVGSNPTNHNEFVLRRDGATDETYQLPVYGRRSKPLGRVLLTPAAAAQKWTP